MKIYYEPTQFNKKLAQVAKERLPGSHEFHPLSKYGAFRRHWQLKRIKEPAVFIWGSGWNHHESYYFTSNKVKAKVNIDQHSDDLAYSKGERVRGVTCVNHVAMTAKLGVETLSIVSSRMNNVQIPENFSSDKMALSVDFDCIPFFPASPIWALMDEKGGYRLETIVKFIDDSKPRIRMLDMGGVANSVPDFIVDNKIRAPKSSDISEFCDKLKTKQPMNKNTANVVLNYALDVYLRVLEAFVKDEKQTNIA